MFFFSLGMVAQEVQQMLKSGVRSHFSDLFNVLDFMLLEGYIGALSLFYWTMQKSKVALTELNGKNLTSLLQHSNRYCCKSTGHYNCLSVQSSLTREARGV